MEVFEIILLVEFLIEIISVFIVLINYFVFVVKSSYVYRIWYIVKS